MLNRKVRELFLKILTTVKFRNTDGTFTLISEKCPFEFKLASELVYNSLERFVMMLDDKDVYFLENTQYMEKERMVREGNCLFDSLAKGSREVAA